MEVASEFGLTMPQYLDNILNYVYSAENTFLLAFKNHFSITQVRDLSPEFSFSQLT